MKISHRRLKMASFAVLAIGLFLLLGWRLQVYRESAQSLCRSCHVMERAWKSLNNGMPEGSPAIRSVFSEYVCQNCHGGGDYQKTLIGATAGHAIHAQEAKINCNQCHTSLDQRDSPPKEACKRCHQDRATGNKAVKIPKMHDLRCTDCHEFLRIDTSLKPAKTLCQQCHQRQKAAPWIERRHARYECWVCHNPHEEEHVANSCDSCHKPANREEVHWVGATDPAGCQSCHEPHEWKIKK